MDLKEALEILVACCEDTGHPMVYEACETARAFIGESLGTNPSPVKVELYKDQGELVHKAFANIPVDISMSLMEGGDKLPLDVVVDPLHDFN